MSLTIENADFYRIIGERIKDFPCVRVGRTMEQLLQKEVVKQIGVADMNALRDRFEGQQFLDNHRSRLFANLAVREYLGENIRRRELNLIDENENFIFIRGVQVEILVTPFGSLPQFKRESYPFPVLIIFQRAQFTFYISGILERIEILNESNYMNKNSNPVFTSFDKLKTLESGL